ncbi:hypothetical protein [Marinobacter flavimaris]|uniref:hypothetical protein n=1 Tax=Marinobacter flavimaris TaxID=262076 RepID=UPI00386988D0
MARSALTGVVPAQRRDWPDDFGRKKVKGDQAGTKIERHPDRTMDIAPFWGAADL